MVRDDVIKIADGRIFTGEQALEVGLVDEMGNLEAAVKSAGKLAGIKGEPILVTKKERFSLLDLLRGTLPDQLREAASTVRVKYLFAP